MTDRRARFVPVSGEVWCDFHGCVHADECDPYECSDDQCEKHQHRTLYVKALPEEEGEF